MNKNRHEWINNCIESPELFKQNTGVDFDEFCQLLNKYTTHSTDNTKRKLYRMLKLLSNFKQKYDDILIPETDDGYFYRGSMILLDEFQKLEKTEMNPIHDWFPYSYKPKTNLQSWTINEEIAEYFAQEESYKLTGDNSPYNARDLGGIIMRVKADDSFILYHGFINELSPNSSENEVLRISDLSILSCEARLIRLHSRAVMTWK